jgi:RNA polymerase-binding transcription factor DksA
MAKTDAKNKPKSKSAAAKKTAAKKTAETKKTAAVKKTAGKSVGKTAAAKKSVPKKTGAKSSSKKTSPSKAKTTKSVKPASAKSRKTTTKTTSATKSGRKIEVVRSAPKAPKKLKGYSKKELEEFKKVILDKRAEIIEQLQNLKEQMMDATTGQYVNENSPYSLHMAEQGTDAQEREKLYLWAQRETKFLGYLEDALQRIENGTYGICIDSLELKEGPHLIPKNRLLAVPHTQHCVECKNKKK